MRPRILLLLLLTYSLLVAQSCGSARRGIPFIDTPPITDSAVQQGQQVFNRICQQCHPGGAAGLAPALNNKPYPGWVIRFQVRHGGGDMPSFPEEKITDEELDAVVQYLKWLRKQEPPSSMFESKR